MTSTNSRIPCVIKPACHARSWTISTNWVIHYFPTNPTITIPNASLTKTPHLNSSLSHLVKLSIYHSPKISTSEQMRPNSLHSTSILSSTSFRCVVLLWRTFHTKTQYLVEWCRRWWLWAPGGCCTIPWTQGLREWPNSRWYCSLVGTGPIQPSFRQDGTCPGRPPGEELSYRCQSGSYQQQCHRRTKSKHV